MPELIAFLNKIDSEGGILALGIDAKDKMPTSILGVDEGTISDESKLRSWIINDIASVPKALDPYTIEFETVNLSDGKNIFLIEIHPRDTNALYYYKKTGRAYKREADTTKPIDLEEAVKLVEEKRIAKLFVELNSLNYHIEGEFVKDKLQIVFLNLGSRPAFRVYLFIGFPSTANQPNAKISVEGLKDKSDINVYKVYMKQFFNDVFYPKRPFVVGHIDIAIERDNPPIQIEIEIDEERGYSRQYFLMGKEGIREDKEKRTFSAY